MDEDTTTPTPEPTGGQTINGVAVDDQGMAVPQPEPSEPVEAVETPTETPEQQETETPAEPSDEDDTSDWLSKKGIDPSDPEAITKLAKSAREAEKAMHRNAQQRSELEKAAKIAPEQIPQDAAPELHDNVRVRNLELRFEAQQWKMQNQDKLAYEPAMVEILSDPNKKVLVQEGYLTMDDVYNMARGSNAGMESNLKSQGKKEALTSLAQKQQAATPRGNATNSAQMASGSKITPQNVDQLVATMSSEEYRRRLPEINRALAG